jgi:vitamin B12 transporter
MTLRFLMAGIILLSIPVAVAADDTKSDTVVVTATRTATTADSTLASVTVITRADIERQQATSLPELLQGTLGIGMSNNGGPGKATSFFLRGAEADQVLVLVNGIKIGSATLGITSFQDIPIDQIERIEIVRGPRSSLYGSEAIGGVIQIFTRKGGGAFTPTFTFGAGSHNSKKTNVSISGGGKRSWYHLGLGRFETNGFNACTGNPVLFSGCFTIEPDDDGYQNQSGSFRIGHRFQNGIEIETHGLHSDNKTDFDGTFVNQSETRQDVIGAKLKVPVTKKWHMSLDLGTSDDKSKNFLNGVFASSFDTRRETVSLQNDVSFGDRHLLTIGADSLQDKIKSTTTFPVRSRDNDGIFVQYQGQFNKHKLLFSLRGDDNEQFGNKTTGNIGWSYQLNKNLRTMASYGTAFKAPTLNQLYFPFFGNANLVPEESKSTEFGLKGKAKWGHWSINAYQTNVKDLITFDPITFLAANINKTRLRGIETLLSTTIAGWRWQTQLTLQDPENRSPGANKGNLLVRRGQRQLRIDLDKKTNKLQLGFSLFAEGRRYDDLANTRKLDKYHTVDFRLGYRINKTTLFQARIGNIFNKNYETAEFFNQDGRNYFFTLQFQPK